MTPETAMLELIGQLPIVMVLYFWLKSERDDRREEQQFHRTEIQYYRNREEIWMGIMADFIKRKTTDTDEMPVVNLNGDKKS